MSKIMEGVNQDFWTFVENNAKEEPSKLRLKYHNRTSMPFDVPLAITQIECRKRFGKKLSDTLSVYPHWLFPTELSGEQSTSDRLAAYHSLLVAPGSKVADLTAGLGIDALHLSREADTVTACDIEAAKTEALSYNIATYNLSNINAVEADCRAFIKDCPMGSYDVVFIDPARRAHDGSRVYALSQCQPDVTAMIDDIKRISTKLIIKMSPMLDITQTLRELSQVQQIIALGTETECKELIAVLDFNIPCGEPEISAVTLKNDGSLSAFTHNNEHESEQTKIMMPEEGDILLEPYPAVMKTAPFNELAQRFGLTKLHNNTHLFLALEIVPDFPGTQMVIEKIMPFSSKNIKGIKKSYPQINVSTRNFQMPADKLRSKLGVKDGGDKRLIAVTQGDDTPIIIIAKPH